MKTFTTAAFLLLATMAFAGNGSTGGGNIYGNQLNPWFLRNTKVVNYCVEIAPEFGHLSRSRVLEVVTSALNYWKSTFKNYNINFKHDFEMDTRLATQDFIFNEACTEKIDLKFQLGFLTPDQVKQYPNYKQLLALAHRTHYDETTLKGRGFIYVAPESGEFRPLSSEMHEKPWSTGNNFSLKYTLIHELGHVFGLQDDHYSSHDIMSAKFVELVASKQAVSSSNGANERMLASPFGCSKDFEGAVDIFYFSSAEVEPTEVRNELVQEGTGPMERLKELLDLPEKMFKLSYVSKGGLIALKVDNKIWGTVKLSNSNLTSNEVDTAITLYLTKNQKVFKKVPRTAYNSHLPLYFVSKSAVLKNETLDLQNGNKLKVFLNFNSRCLPQIGTVIDDEVFMNIFNYQ